jgi:hypothetical protein
MSVTWVLEQDVFSEQCFTDMVAHMQAQAIPHHVIKVIPFIHEIEGKPPVINGPCVVYGSIGAQKLALAHGWSPGVFGTPETMSETAAAHALGELYLNGNMQKMPILNVVRYLTNNPQVLEFFIKPDTDTKEFAGTVLTSEEFQVWYERMRLSGYLDDTNFNVVLAKPRVLGCEWRVVVVAGEISSSSLYVQYQRVMPERHILPEVAEIVRQAHTRYQPAPVYVIDIAQVDDGFKVLEYNTFNSAGLYACDVAKVIDDVNAYLER